MSELTVGAGLARGLIDLAVAKGADRQALLAQAGLDADLLKDQDNRVPAATYRRLMRAAQALARDPALALHYGETVDLSDVSIVGLIMNASETMMESFVQMNRFGRLAAEAESGGFTLAQENGAMWLVDNRADPNDFPEGSEDVFARLTCGPRRFLPRAHVLEVNFTHPAPAYRAEYERIFRCPVMFESRWNAMRMDASLAFHKVQLQPRYVFGVLSAKAEELLKSLQDSKSTRGRVEQLLLPVLHRGEIGMETIAGRLGVSRQTLYRQLKDEGTTFEGVLDDLRHRMALYYLGGKKVSVNETAYLVGFSEPAAFSRAFKRWTGTTPGQVRATN